MSDGIVTTPPTAARASVGERALDWWRRYCHPEDGDPGVRAQLRRCRSPMDAFSITPAVNLARRLGALRTAPSDEDQRLMAALGLARVLAHVTEHVTERPMQSAGWKTFPNDRRESDAGDDRPRLAEARFRRLLETGSGEEQVTAFIRLVAILDGKINISALATDYLDWTHPRRGDRIRQRWAFDYYAAGAAAPTDPSTAEDEE